MSDSDYERQLRELDAVIARKDRAIQDLTEAIRYTVEYIGTKTLPPYEGWSWYDALREHAPEKAQALLNAHRRAANDF